MRMRFSVHTRQDEEFWRAHHEAWKRSDLNQRQYCDAEGIPLKAFGNGVRSSKPSHSPRSAAVASGFRGAGSFGPEDGNGFSRMSGASVIQNWSTSIAPHIGFKIIMKRAYNVGAASIADKINSRFSQSPYDRHADLYSASICSIEDYTLLTSKAQGHRQGREPVHRHGSPAHRTACRAHHRQAAGDRGQPHGKRRASKHGGTR